MLSMSATSSSLIDTDRSESLMLRSTSRYKSAHYSMTMAKMTLFDPLGWTIDIAYQLKWQKSHAYTDS